MTRFLGLAALLVACTDGAPTPSDTLTSAPGVKEADIPIQPPHQNAVLDVGIVDLGGVPVEWGELNVEGRWLAFDDASVVVAVPSWSNVEVIVRTDDNVVTLFPYATTEFARTGELAVPTLAEAERLADAFGVDPLPGTGVVMQHIDGPEGYAPVLPSAGLGPFFLDAYGQPVPDATGLPGNAGTALFFDVPEGIHALELPDCNEGYGFWGQPGDGKVLLAVPEDGWTMLGSVDCGLLI